MKPGKRFEQKFRASVDADSFAMRIADKVFQAQGKIYSEESEADFLVSSGAGIFLIECKATLLNNLPFRQVKDHQMNSLLEFDTSNEHAHGLLAVEFYNAKSYRAPKIMYLLDVNDWIAYTASSNRKSMPRSAFEQLGIECPYQGSIYALDFGRWSGETKADTSAEHRA